MSNTQFMAMKNSRQQQISKLSEQLTKASGSQQPSGKDQRLWEPTVDKLGNGHAIIRFLPAPKNEDVPFVRVFTHGFKGPTGSWYIENSLTTIGQPDPVSEMNTKLWNTGLESDKKIVRDRKRKLNFYSNIYVVKDPENPSNEGKVFLFRYGKKIFDKLNDLMVPQFDDEQPVNPFDFWEGANFKLRIRNVEGYRNFDKSEFEAPSPLSTDDSALEKIWNSQHSLQEFIDPKNFKSYDQLKARLDRVLGLDSEARVAASDQVKPAVQAKQLPTALVDGGSDDDDDEDFDKILKSLTKD